MAPRGLSMTDLIDLIYETVAEPALWSAVVDRMSREIRAQSFWMFHMDEAGPDFLAVQGLSTGLLDPYQAHFHSHDILMAEELRRPQDFRGRAVREQEIVGEKVWQASTIYNELARPHGMHHVLSMNLSDAKTKRVPFLAFFRPPGRTMFEDFAVSSCEGLIPHLRRAIRLKQLISVQRKTIPTWTATLLDRIPAGVFLLDGQGKVLHANAFGQTVVDRRDRLALRDGRLIATGDDARDGLDRILAASVSAHPRGGEIRLVGGESSWVISVCPLPERAAGMTGEEHCRAFVWVSDASAGSRDLSRRLGTLFGLTAAEQRVAAALARSLAPAEIAERRRVSLNTVRTQVRSIFDKLGVGRQVELARLLAEIAALPRPYD
jgi:DNA-binding CsgD family transcriptional regulator